MNLREAKEILEKNGYKLVETYNAVTDRNIVKDKGKFQSYFTNVLVRLKNALAEEGIRSSVSSDKHVLKFGRYIVSLYDTSDTFGDVEEYDLRFTGPESGKDASYSSMENEVTLILWADIKRVDTADFDVRNTPSMVEWILEHIEV